jgi:hypothetical protein
MKKNPDLNSTDPAEIKALDPNPVFPLLPLYPSINDFL